MTERQREQVRKAMSLLARQPRTMTDKAREQRAKAIKNRWDKVRAAKGLPTIVSE